MEEVKSSQIHSIRVGVILWILAVKVKEEVEHQLKSEFEKSVLEDRVKTIENGD